MHPLNELKPGDIVLRNVCGSIMPLLIQKVGDGRIMAAVAPGIEYEFSMDMGEEIDLEPGVFTFSDVSRLLGGEDLNWGPSGARKRWVRQ